jgi:hypothetical protein
VQGGGEFGEVSGGLAFQAKRGEDLRHSGRPLLSLWSPGPRLPRQDHHPLVTEAGGTWDRYAPGDHSQ